ncbi:UDP-2,3-diacylglucosamine diphosphatase [Aromatoleum aromaticum]|uniref:UDP-2,3-diacylglucosamine diphosphatase n=1 Tax=Aromatoleum aromaticum TaxID=551760 RepID=UPI00169D79DA|nr:UDP-2,3-diacylglucosamine diphosphatase [Aromatoleum aromaticum]NMG53228.1 UDP-2,3-diacylglucosamine diphosphatase [Aromatoleum aromaticum]
MSALFISDLHLCEQRPVTLRAFFAFLQGPARSVQALYILGDLFEYWAGDDDATPLGNAVSDALAALAETGTSLFFLPGNRDFLLGESFARRARLRILPDPTLIDFDNEGVLLSHGDILCTDDEHYQSFRRLVRDPAWQLAFLERPLAQRKQVIEGLRFQSETAKQEKASDIMDVNAFAVETLLREHGYPTLIHGHTHRPAHHVHVVDGRSCERWVLADWHDDAPYLRWDGAGPPVALRFGAKLGT